MRRSRFIFLFFFLDRLLRSSCTGLSTFSGRSRFVRCFMGSSLSVRDSHIHHLIGVLLGARNLSQRGRHSLRAELANKHQRMHSGHITVQYEYK